MIQKIDYIFSFAHRETGIFSGVHLTISDPAAVALNTPADHIAVAGHHDHLSRRVDMATSEVIDYQPPQPSADHEWNADTKRWQLSQAEQAKAAAAAAARARHAELIRQQHDDVRRAILGDVAAQQRLLAIEAEISSLGSFHSREGRAA